MTFGEAIAFCLTGVCVLIYVPVIMNAFRQIQRGEVILTNVTPMNPQPKRYTGAAATVYALAQALSAVILIGGAMAALTNSNLGFIVVGFVISMVVGWGGLKWADQLGYELIEPDFQGVMNTFAQFLNNATGGMGFDVSNFGSTKTPSTDADSGDTVIMDDTEGDNTFESPDIEDAEFRPIDSNDTSTPDESDDSPVEK